MRPAPDAAPAASNNQRLRQSSKKTNLLDDLNVFPVIQLTLPSALPGASMSLS